MVDTSTTSKVWPGQSFSSSDMTKRVWINANSDFLEPTRWLFNMSSGISSERINPVHLSLSLTVLYLIWAKQICKKSSTSKWRNNKPGRQSRLPALSLARSLCVSLQSRWLYIVIYHHWAYVYEERFSFFNFLSESEHFLGVLGMCTPVCGSDVMFV